MAGELSDLDRLLEQAKCGDESAYRGVFEHYRSMLIRLIDLRINGRLRQRIDASDIVQETYLETLQRLAEYMNRRPMPFELWLKRSARQQLARCYRVHGQAAQRTIAREQSLPEDSASMLAASLTDGCATPSEQMVRQEYHAVVQQAISRLTAADRELLLMRHVEQMPYGDIGVLLNIDEAAARKRYGRALLRLRQRLASLGVEGLPGE